MRVSRTPLNYRLFFYDRHRHIRRVENIACVTDRLACEQAKVLQDGGPVEIWEAARMVARIEPNGDQTDADDYPSH